NQAEQEEVIAKILFFVEKHWNEMFRFSRRSQYNMDRWSARYGFEKTGKEILEKAKSGYTSRYVAVNLKNYYTIEFRLFRGTLKYNTFIATLQMVQKICDVALSMSQEDLENLSWSEFVAGIETPELIQYLKERRLYINEKITIEEGEE
ncbi:MAG: zinc-binding protein, partial [Oscillospiraceae bacterium]|nr:zinc-binding protein [Oscillospiraceae bacterium]